MNENTTYSDISQLHHQLREEVSKKWGRVLPFAELITDRWEKAKFLNAGENSSIYDSAVIFGDVTIGSNTWIGPYTIIDGSGGLSIGDFCSIASGVQIYSHDTVKWAVSGGKEGYERERVKIGNCCYIGPMSLITKGVEIGDHCIIGANSMINRDIPPFSIAYGSPARIMGRVHLDENGTVTLEHFSKKPENTHE